MRNSCLKDRSASSSLPNASTAIRLGLAGRGEALVSETLNSNTINLAFGIVVPALFVTAARAPAGFVLDFVWMLAVTLAMLVLVGRRGGAGRLAGAAIVASYIAYVVVRIATSEAKTVNGREIPDISLQHMVAVMLVDRTVSLDAAHDKKRMQDPVVLRQRAKAQLEASLR